MFRLSTFVKKIPFLNRLRPKFFLNGSFNFPANFRLSTGTIRNLRCMTVQHAIHPVLQLLWL